MNPPKTDSEYQAEAERLAREVAVQSASLRFPHKTQQNAAKVYIEETTKVILDTIPYLASLLRAQDERDSIGVRWCQEQAKCIQLRAENDALKAELAKWKLGCETNADNYRTAVRKQDNQRLEIIGLRTALTNLMPFVLEDYMPSFATPDFRAAVEAAKYKLE